MYQVNIFFKKSNHFLQTADCDKPLNLIRAFADLGDNGFSHNHPGNVQCIFIIQ